MLSSMSAAAAVVFTKWFFGEYLGNFIALNSLYRSTGNYVITYLRSAANRINVLILGQFRLAISRQQFNRLHKSLQFGKEYFKRFIFCDVTHQTFLLFGPENMAQMDSPSSKHCIIDWFRFSRKLLKLATPNSMQTYSCMVSSSSQEMTSSVTSGRQQMAKTCSSRAAHSCC